VSRLRPQLWPRDGHAHLWIGLLRAAEAAGAGKQLQDLGWAGLSGNFVPSSGNRGP
jgi:hypothetical protein